jgi:ATP-dependent protease ClpP protease subunit
VVYADDREIPVGSIARTTAVCYLVVSIFHIAPVYPAEIGVQISGDAAGVVIQGRLNHGDEDIFRARIAALHTPSIGIGLNSPGGDLRAGIEIGTIIRMRGLATGVPVGAECASACGLIWLAGTPRVILYDDQGNYGRVGFHAAVNAVTGQQSVGNAIAGAYFNRLGLSDDAIAYMTDAPPDSIQWLTSADADRLGIKVNYVKEAPSTADTKTSESIKPVRTDPTWPAPTTLEPTQAVIEEWLRGFFAAGNAPSNVQTRDTILSWYYGPQHGGQTWSFTKYLSPDELVKEKVKFMARWPRRLYTLREGSVSFNWKDKDLLDVTGIVDWTCSSDERHQTSMGSQQFTFSLHRESLGGFTIVSENGQIITRTVSKDAVGVYEPAAKPKTRP